MKMVLLEEVGFLLFCAVLSIEDIRSRSLSAPILAAGLVSGLFACLSHMLRGAALSETVLNHLPGLVLSNLLIVFALKFHQLLGMGDALCFFCLSLWKPWQRCLSLLILSFLFLGIVGAFIMITKKKGRKFSLPLMPFLLAAELVLLAGEGLPAV